MNVAEVLQICLVLGYFVLMLILAVFSVLPADTTQKVEVNGFSILIPFKNEADNLNELVQSLITSLMKYNQQNCEVIFINDHSTDDSLDVLKEALQNTVFEYTIIETDEGVMGKKQAIQLGISTAKYDRIITLDADCKVDENWMIQMSKLTDGLGIGVVIQHDENNKFTLLNALQSTEGMLLQGITIGSSNLQIPLLCSGANLSYSKSDFLKIKPYSDNTDIASGDDMFLLTKFIENDVHIVPVKNAIVYTKTEDEVVNYLKRSVRWIAKTTDLKMPVLFFISILTFVVNVIFIYSLFFWLFEGSTFHLFNCLIKFLVDFLFLFSLSIVFKKLYLLIFAPLIALVYPIYLIVIGILMIRYNKKVWN
jgi:poly-beta-1,6-N-acetyl-D-glucosamine synthase